MHLVNPQTDPGKGEYARRFGEHNFPSSHSYAGGSPARNTEPKRYEPHVILHDPGSENQFIAGIAQRSAPFKFPKRKKTCDEKTLLHVNKSGIALKASYLKYSSDNSDELLS